MNQLNSIKQELIFSNTEEYSNITENAVEQLTNSADENLLDMKSHIILKIDFSHDENHVNIEENQLNNEEIHLINEENPLNIEENSQDAVSPETNKETVKRKLDSKKGEKTVRKRAKTTNNEVPLDVGEMTSKNTTGRSRNVKYFQQDWFDEFPSWKEWVVRLTNDSKYYCKICEKTMLCGRKEIKQHEVSRKHQKKKELTEKLIKYGYVLNNANNVPVLFSTINTSTTSNTDDKSPEPKGLTFKQKVKEAEEKLTRFFLENHIPFMLSPKIIGLFREIEPLVLKDVRLSSSKMSVLAKEILQPNAQEKIIFPKTRRKLPIKKDSKK